MYRQQFTAKRGDRPGVPNMAFVIAMDINDQELDDIRRISELAREDNITILPLIISPNANYYLLEALAGDFLYGNILSDYEQLLDIQDEINHDICNSATSKGKYS